MGAECRPGDLWGTCGHAHDRPQIWPTLKLRRQRGRDVGPTRVDRRAARLYRTPTGRVSRMRSRGCGEPLPVPPMVLRDVSIGRTPNRPPPSPSSCGPSRPQVRRTPWTAGDPEIEGILQCGRFRVSLIDVAGRSPNNVSNINVCVLVLCVCVYVYVSACVWPQLLQYYRRTLFISGVVILVTIRDHGDVPNNASRSKACTELSSEGPATRLARLEVLNVLFNV